MQSNDILLKRKLIMLIICALLFKVGFFASINGVLLNYFKVHFDLTYLAASVITFIFFLAYFIMSMPFGWLAHRFGYRLSLQLSLIIGLIGCLLFVIAIRYDLFWLILASLFFIASFVTGVEVAANPLIDSLGVAESSSQRLTIIHFLDSIGTIVGPQFAAFILFYNSSQAVIGTKITVLYLILASILGGFWCLISYFLRNSTINKIVEDPVEIDSSKKILRQHKPLMLGLAAIFIYVGCEVSIANFLISFAIQPEVAHLMPEQAAIWLSLYWGGQMLGRLIAAFFLAKVRPNVPLAICGILAIIFLIFGVSLPGHLGLYFIAAVGLANSIMYPTIFSLAVKGLGKLKSKASGILHMGVIGGGLVPLVQGFIADELGITLSYLLPAILYTYIVYYALWGSSVGQYK